MCVRAALSKVPFTDMAAPTQCPKCDTLSDTRNQKILKCGMCDKLWHHNCAGINVKSYDVLIKTKNSYWFCDPCDSVKVLAELKEFRDFKQQHENLSSKFSAMEAKLQQIEQKLLEQPPATHAPDHEMVATIFRDEFEAEKRKSNLCVFGMPPSNDDRAAFVQLCSEKLEVPTSELEQHITEVRRVGSNASGTDDRPSPLIVKLSSLSTKGTILKNAPKLKTYRPTNSSLKVYIAHDLTRKQQVEAKRVRDEMLRRRSRGEDVTIYRGKIVTRRQRQVSSSSSDGELTPAIVISATAHGTSSDGAHVPDTSAGVTVVSGASSDGVQVPATPASVPGASGVPSDVVQPPATHGGTASATGAISRTLRSSTRD